MTRSTTIGSQIDSSERGLDRFVVALAILLTGYLLFDRAFAWLHIPGTPVFAGEIVLALGLAGLISTRVRLGSLLRTNPPLIMLTVYLGWGFALLVLGIGSYGVASLRDSTIWYYGLFAILLPVSMTVRPMDWWVQWYARLLPWFLLWLPVALMLNSVAGSAGPTVPDSPVSIFSHHGSFIAVHCGIALAFIWGAASEDRRMRTYRTLLSSMALLTMVVACMSSRASLVATGVAGLIFLAGLPRTRSRLVLFAVALLVTVLGLTLVFDVELALSRDRERMLSAEQLVENVVSIFNPEEVDESLSGTSDWRTELWSRVLGDVTNQRPVTGFGFGVNIREMYGEQDESPPARNPHSSHVNVVARMGWIGAAIWVAMWSTWFVSLFRARRRFVAAGLNAAGGLALVIMVGVVMLLIQGIFNEVIEAPQSAVWLWSLFGFGAYLASATPRAPAPLRIVVSHR